MRLTMPTLGRGLLLSSAALLVALSVSGCGRRGPLEPPEAAAASPAVTQPGAPADARLRRSRTSVGQPVPRATTLATNPGAVVEDNPDDDADDAEQIESVVPSPTPSARKRGRNYLVPKDPFILDALL